VQFDYDGFDVEDNDGVQTAGPGMNLNLTGNGQFLFTFLNTDSPVQVDVTATTFGTTNSVSVGSFMTAGNVIAPTTYSLSFASLGLGPGSTSGFNVSDLDRLTVRFTPTGQDGDFGLASISAAPVPEPASLAILGVGVISLLRRKMKKA